MFFPVVMYGCESRTIKLSNEELMLLNCGVGEDSSEYLGLQRDPASQPKGNKSWIFFGRTDAETEAPILWPPDGKNWLTGKDPDAGTDWRQKKRITEDEIVRWHHWLNAHEFEQAPGIGVGQGSLVGYSPWGCIELDWAIEMNWQSF